MRHNRKPILLLFGNGYDSQLLLAVLLKLRKTFTIAHLAEQTLDRKVLAVLQKANQRNVIFRPDRKHVGYKTFYGGDIISLEDLMFGFSAKDYFIIAGFKLSEPSLMKAYEKGTFDNMYCPLLRYSDGWIETLYQDMKDNEEIGSFLFENNTTDSHHNISII
jgi:hypothetical protein